MAQIAETFVNELVVDASKAEAGIRTYETAIGRAAAASSKLKAAVGDAEAATEKTTAAQRVALRVTEQAERALARYVDRHDPAVRAQQALEKAENAVATARRRGIEVTEQQARTVEMLRQKVEALRAAEGNGAAATLRAVSAQSEAMKRYAAANENAAMSTRRFNGFVQQAGYQVSDAANQLATGTNAFTVFGMQAGQLLGTLGPVGAAIGAVVNVAGVAAGAIQKQAEAAAEAAKATDLLTVAQRAGLEITESGVDKARRLRDERNEQAAASYRAAIAERELADAIAISAALSARSAMEQTQASNARYLAQGPGRFLGPAELTRIEYEKKVYEDTAKTATETSKRLNEAQQAYENFRSGLTKTGGYSGEELEKLRERVDGTVSSYDDATLRTVTLRQKQEELGEAVKAGVITQAQADDILQKYTKHLDENSAAAKEAAKSARDREKAEEKLEKQILAAVKAADAKAVEEYNKVMGEGRRIYEATRTPAEKYADGVANLQRLLAAGAIDQDTFNRAVQEADPALQQMKRVMEESANIIPQTFDRAFERVGDSIADAFVKGKGAAVDFKNVMDGILSSILTDLIKFGAVNPFKDWLFGTTSASLWNVGGGSAANQNGGVTGQLTNFGLSQGGSWAMDKLGITGGMSGLMNTPLWTGSSGIAPGFVDTIGATQITNTSAMTGGGATLGGVLGAAGAGAAGGGLVGGYLGTKTNSKVVGGISGAAAGAGAAYLASALELGALGGPWGIAIGAVVGAIMGMIGTQKATVGKTASADVTINAGGRSATYGNVQTDNEGDPEAGKALGTALSGIFSIAAMGGGSLVKDFGIGSTAKNGLYVGGSVPYKEFGEDIAGLLRYTLLEQGGLKGGGANTIAALKATTAKDWEEATKDIALGASIDAGNTALREMVKTLGGVTDAAKKATTESFAPMFEELSRAQKLGIDGAYKALATDQLKAYLDQLRNPPNFTQTEQDMAALKGQFQATREAYAQLNPEMVTYVDQIERETQARMAANLNKGLDQQINEASGRGYLNQIGGFLTTLDENTRSLAAVGEPATRANNLFNASLGGLLKTLTTDQLTDVVRTFGGDIGRLAQQIGAANDNVQQATRFETLFGQIRQDNINAEISALNEQKSAANSLLSSWKSLQSSIGQARQSLLVGDLSTLDPKSKMDTALAAYREALGKAQGGDVDAAGQVSGLAQTALQAARAYYASNEDYARIFSEVTGGLEGVEGVAARQVRLQSDTVGRLDGLIKVQQDALKELQNRLNPEDVAALVGGMTSGNAGDISAWARSQGPGVESQIKRGRLEALSNADIERLFGGFSDIQAARSSDPSFNLAAWFKAYGIGEVLAGTRSIPGFATGTDSAPPGMAWVGEQGRELVQMAGGERVYPHSVSMDIARSWGVANDRWAGVAEFRRPAASGGGNAALIQRMERQIALLEEQNQLLRQGNSTAGAVGDRVVSRLDGVKDEVRGSAARAEFTKKKVA